MILFYILGAHVTVYSELQRQVNVSTARSIKPYLNAEPQFHKDFNEGSKNTEPFMVLLHIKTT